MRDRYIKSKGVFWGAVAVISVILCAVILAVTPGAGSNARGETIKNEGDGFVLTETEYDKTERFVYTATVRFVSGKAAGLVFGALDGERYWVFNVDRDANKVKLLYFASNGNGIGATELIADYFIGNDKMTESEKQLVEPKVKNIDKVQLKVVISPEDDGVIAEFYADNIRRFGTDNVIKLDELERLPNGVSYEGGKLGYNCYASEVAFEDVYTGASDYSYYTELYRQQYHFSQYAHWNNDPNGLVYYDGWYHLYYQHHPFSNFWSDMYWGHARSRDLLHWEHLPICLFPDRDFGEGDGFMWSGSAMVYRKGMSDAIDALDWYPAGGGTGLIAFYTRDGGRHDQMIMSSDDGGMTWTKRKLIPQSLATGDIGKTDCRDPKVFPVQRDGSNKVTMWGMALTGMKSFDVWFLKSSDLYNWQNAGGFKVDGAKVECPDVVTLTADDGTARNVMTFTGRTYMVGEIDYDETSGNIIYKVNGTDVNGIDGLPLVNMDNGPDSYATQTFYIDDPKSEYYGQTVSLSWFSGVPGAAASIESGSLAAARKTWNGGGMTIPVEWGLKASGNGYVLTQTPITVTSAEFGKLKTEMYSGEGVKIDENSENVLSDVNSHCIEIAATVENPEGAPVAIRINVGQDEYTEIGWNKDDGYYVDRSNTANAGISMNNYAVKYSSGIVGATNKQSFYILSDNGGVEAFCDGFSVPFYVLTFASPYSVGAQFAAGGSVTADITVSGISSVWNAGGTGDETILYLDTDSIELDRTLTPSKEVTAFSTSGAEIAWSVVSGDDIVKAEKTLTGAKISAIGTGSAVIAVTSGNAEKRINVKVVHGTADSDIEFVSSGIASGDWYVTDDGITGVQAAGDGFILSSERGDDFVYVARVGFTGAAAAVVFRADADMSDYLIANYDNNGKVVKLWSPRGEIARADADLDPSDVVVKITAQGKHVKVDVNNRTFIDVMLSDGEPTDGLFGLNVCAGRAAFGTVALVLSEYSYSDNGALTVRGEIAQTITALYNATLGNIEVARELYTVNGRTLTLSREYFVSLDKVGTYSFKAVGERTSFMFDVKVTSLPKVSPADMTLEYGSNAVVYIGGASVQTVTLNGKTLDADGYYVRNGMLTVLASGLVAGDNTLAVSDLFEITITVKAAHETTVRVPVKESNGASYTGIVVGVTVAAVAVVAAGVAVLLILLNKKKHIFGKGKGKAPDEENVVDEENVAKTEDTENGGNN